MGSVSWRADLASLRLLCLGGAGCRAMPRGEDGLEPQATGPARQEGCFSSSRPALLGTQGMKLTPCQGPSDTEGRQECLQLLYNGRGGPGWTKEEFLVLPVLRMGPNTPPGSQQHRQHWRASTCTRQAVVPLTPAFTQEPQSPSCQN